MVGLIIVLFLTRSLGRFLDIRLDCCTIYWCVNALLFQWWARQLTFSYQSQDGIVSILFNIRLQVFAQLGEAITHFLNSLSIVSS